VIASGGCGSVYAAIGSYSWSRPPSGRGARCCSGGAAWPAAVLRAVGAARASGEDGARGDA
jgi:hypothetical protein